MDVYHFGTELEKRKISLKSSHRDESELEIASDILLFNNCVNINIKY